MNIKGISLDLDSFYSSNLLSLGLLIRLVPYVGSMG